MATVGSILKVTVANWVDEALANQYPIQRRWQWTKNGVDIDGAVGGVYTLQTSDIGATISVREIAGFISPTNNGLTLETPAATSTATATGVSVTGSALSSLLVQKENLVYQGSFLMPPEFLYETQGMSFNASGHGGQKTITAFIRYTSTPTYLTGGEFSIPSLNPFTNFASIASLQTAVLLRPNTGLVDPTEGARASSGVLTGQSEPSFEYPGSGITSAGKLIFSYMANWITTQAYSVFYRRPFDLSATGNVEGPFIIIDPDYQTNPRWTGGSMCPIPSTTVSGINYQTALGGDFLVGANGLSIIDTMSDGPSALSFSSSNITAALATGHSGTAQGGSTTQIILASSANATDGYYVGQYIVAAEACTGARKIIAYTGSSQTATIATNREGKLWDVAIPTSSTQYKTVPYVSGRQLIGYVPSSTSDVTPLDNGWNVSVGAKKFAPIWGRRAQAFGMVIPNGTKSLLFFGFSGDGYNNYGNRGDVKEGTRIYDPEEQSVHGYPYSEKVWAYNLDELAAVYANPASVGFNSVKPYAIFNFALPGDNSIVIKGARGMTYDPGTRILYVSQQIKDGYPYYGRVIVHAYLVNNAVSA